MNENFRQYIKENGHCELPNTMTSVDDEAFSGCTDLKSIYIPSSISAIGKSAFRGCTELETVVLQPGLKSIAKGAFYNCSKLSNINIPGTVSEINAFAFFNCKSIESIKIPSALSVIKMGCFSGCSKLSGIKIPSTISEIESLAFANCMSLRKAIISNSVKALGDGIFKGSSSLRAIMLPLKFSTMGELQRLCISPKCTINPQSSHSHHSSLNSSRSSSSSSLSLRDLKTSQTSDSMNTNSFNTNDISLSGLPLPSTTTMMSMHPGDTLGITADILDTESIASSDRHILFSNMLCDTPKTVNLISKLSDESKNSNDISRSSQNQNDNRFVSPIWKGSPLNSSDLTGTTHNNFDVNALIDSDGVNNIPPVFPVTKEKSDDSLMVVPISSNTAARRKVLRNTKTIYTEISGNEAICTSNSSSVRKTPSLNSSEKDIDMDSSLLNNMNESIVNETVVPVNSITVKKETKQNVIEKTSLEQLNEEIKEASVSRSSTPKISTPVINKQNQGSIYSALSTPVADKPEEPQKRKGGCFKKKN